MTDKPTYQELVNALCDVMDGMWDARDIHASTGLPIDDCEKILKVRDKVKDDWEI